MSSVEAGGHEIGAVGGVEGGQSGHAGGAHDASSSPPPVFGILDVHDLRFHLGRGIVVGAILSIQDGDVVAVVVDVVVPPGQLVSSTGGSSLSDQVDNDWGAGNCVGVRGSQFDCGTRILDNEVLGGGSQTVNGSSARTGTVQNLVSSGEQVVVNGPESNCIRTNHYDVGVVGTVELNHRLAELSRKGVRSSSLVSLTTKYSVEAVKPSTAVPPAPALYRTLSPVVSRL